MLDQAREQREVVREIREHAFQIALHRASTAAACTLGGLARVPPFRELMRDGLLDRLAIGEIRGAARAGPDEVALVEREAFGQGRDLDEAADVLGAPGVRPSQSQPRLMTFPNVLTATPRWSSGSGAASRTR